MIWPTFSAGHPPGLRSCSEVSLLLSRPWERGVKMQGGYVPRSRSARSIPSPSPPPSPVPLPAPGRDGTREPLDVSRAPSYPLDPLITLILEPGEAG